MNSTSSIYVNLENPDCQATSTEDYTKCETSHLDSHLMLAHSEKSQQVLTKKTLSKSPASSPKGRKGVSGDKGGKGGYRGQKTAVAGDGGFEFRYPLNSQAFDQNKFLTARGEMFGSYTDERQITIPLVIDTEFTTEASENYQQKGRTLITTQIKGIHKDAPAIMYAHHPVVNKGRVEAGLEPCLIPSTLFDVADYLRDVGGCEVSVREANSTLLFLKELPRCNVVLYAHFATAEINLISRGSLKTYIKQLQRSKGEDQILSGRRLYCQSSYDGKKLDTVSLKHIITIDDVEFELCLKIVDTGALHGIASYADIAAAVGHELPYKKVFTDDEKGRMLVMAEKRSLDFENYALGDLDVYEILEKYDIQWRKVYEILDFSDYYREPKLTIGGSVKDLFEASLAYYFQLEPKNWVDEFKEIVKKFIQPGSADKLRNNTNFTSALLSKVEGGRCRNNRPIEMSVKNLFKTEETQLTRKRQLIEKLRYYGCILCDIDISSCYGEGQRNQDYPIGEPEIFHYKHSDNNECVTLREWLNSYGVKTDTLIKCAENKDVEGWKNTENWGELVPGLWHMRVTNKNKLLYPQDLLASWFMDTSHGVDMLAKALKEMKCDTEMLTTENVSFDEDTGSLKIFNYDIKNGALTHDGLQWVLAVCSKRQRNELLDTLLVDSSMVYPASRRIDVAYGKEGLEKLKKGKLEWKGKNTTRRIKNEDGTATIQMNFREYHGWFSVNLGELLVDKLLVERKKAKIEHGEKSPLDILFKLCVNTLYGDMVSKFFVTSNPTVGNNITARARVLAWYMEKGLHGHQPITDGCAFWLNWVLFPGRDNINGECVNLHRADSKLSQRMIKRGFLGGGKIGGQWVDLIVDGKNVNIESIELIDGKPFLEIDGEKVECCPRWVDRLSTGDTELSETLKKVKKPYLVDENGVTIENSLEWINEMAMKHLQNIFPLVDVLHKPSTALSIDKKTLEVKRSPRIGQFSFEVKDIYHSGAFHGTANYALENPNGLVIKARGYETKREHIGVELDSEQDDVEFMKSDRYGIKNNPAKDFMKQILDNPESITRQIPAIKQGILKVGDYKNHPDRHDYSKIEPGDNINKVLLMQEFSLSQFTFQTYEQYISWKKLIEKAKDKHKQSLEGFFLNDDNTLNLQAMCEWVDGAIASGVMNPFDELKDKNRNDRRTEKTVKAQAKKTETRGKQLKRAVAIDHPQLETVTSLKAQLNNPPD
ncbi:hypothetical protein QUB33_26465 [Microcoleus sp. B3-A4]|uniref:hypothetical protein n=1 Tax=Microcoleus sp. B3-A4 TaxID=2818653 RepID=UPI002FD02364